MYNLYNLQENKYEQFDSGAAKQALQSGNYTVRASETYNLINPSGDLVGVDGTNIFDAINNGYEFANEEVISGAKKKREYDDKNIKAATLGAARGASIYTSDLALKGMYELNPELSEYLGLTPEEIRLIKENNPSISTVFELIGSVAPAIYAGFAGAGASAAARAAGTTAAGVAGKQAAKKGLAELVKKGVKITPSYLSSKLSIEGEKALTRLLLRKVPVKSALGRGLMAGTGAAGVAALEGATWEVGRLASESSLGEIDFSASNIWDYASSGAKIGASLGFMGGFITEGVGTAARNLMRKKPDLGLDIMDAGLGVSSEHQKKFLLNPDGLEGLRDKEELAKEIKSRYDRVFEEVEKGRADIDELKEIIKFQESSLNKALKEKVSVFKDVKKDLDKAYTNWSNANKMNPVDETFLNDIDNSIDSLNSIIGNKSKRSYDILDDSGIDSVMTKKEIIDIIDDEINKMNKLSFVEEKAVKDLQRRKDLLNKNVGGKLITKTGEGVQVYGDYNLTPRKVKSIIRSIDIDSEYYYNRSAAEFAPIKGKALVSVRRRIDDILKDRIPAYRDIMKEVSDLMQVRSKIIKRFPNREKLQSYLKTLYQGRNQGFVGELIDLARVTGNNWDNQINSHMEKQLLSRGQAIAGYVPVAKEWDPIQNKYVVSTRKLDPKEKAKQQLYSRDLRPDYLKMLEAQKDYNTIMIGEKLPTSELKDEFLRKKLKWVADFKIRELKNQLTEKGAVLAESIKQLEELKRFKTLDETRNFVQTELSSADSKRIKEVFGFLGSISKPDEIRDFVSWVELLRLQHVFDRRFTRGSKNVDFWSGIAKGAGAIGGAVVGGGVGGFLGGAAAAQLAGTVLGGLGYVLGSYVDRYGPRIALRILKSISNVKGKLTPDKVTGAAIGELGFNDAGKAFFYEANKAQQMIHKFNRKMIYRIKKGTENFIKVPLRSGIKINTSLRDVDTKNKTYRDLRAQMEKVEESKNLYLSGVEDINDVLFPVMPNIMESFRQKAIKSADFLMSKFPKQPLNDLFDQWEPSRYELDKFKTYYKYVFNPSLVFDEIENGYIPTEGIEVLRTIHPTLYNYAYESFVNLVFKENEYTKLEPSKKFQLAKHFDINPLDIYRYDKIMVAQNMQSPLADQGQQPQSPGQPEQGQNAGQASDNMKQTGLNSLSMDERTETRMNRVNNRV